MRGLPGIDYGVCQWAKILLLQSYGELWRKQPTPLQVIRSLTR